VDENGVVGLDDDENVASLFAFAGAFERGGAIACDDAGLAVHGLAWSWSGI
jgi:hypothetical protein